MPEIADFRSDTVTRPTAAMRHAMAEAVVDDDVLGHDPTTLELEKESAHLVNKEAALFVPSGTMANLVAIMTHASHGEEVILEEWAHSSRFEAGGAGAVAGVQLRTLRSDRGLMDAGEIGEWISPGTDHTSRTALVCVEQTHNFHGGAVLPINGLREICEVCRGAEVPLHMDGARLWNAVAATDITAAEYADLVDTVSFCLSKGLCAPVGSVLCGSEAFIAEARNERKRLGGGMRQSGVIAAAGLVALREMRGRLKMDHLRAGRIARALSDNGPFSVDTDAVRTNIVFVNTGTLDAFTLVEKAESHGILFLATGPRQIRIVTHNDIDDDDVERLMTLFSKFSR